MSQRHTEYHSCVGLAEWWAYACRAYGIPECLLLHIPAQGNGAARGFHLKKMGVRKGTPDYILAVPNPRYPGLFIELKSADGVVRPEQKTMMETLTAQGYLCRVCRSAGEARDIIEAYLKNQL